jgi:biopolymer transport protein ExbD
MRKLKKHRTHLSYEFELDLAPLLAVMVKLVPVLLISSAFVQIMIVETDLPQVVKEAIADNAEVAKAAIHMDISKTGEITIKVSKAGTEKSESIPAGTGGAYDLVTLQSTLQKVKSENPEVFKIELAPEAKVAYKDIIKIVDEARRAKTKDVRFPIFDKKANKQSSTDYMFPEVVFSNVMDG